MAIRTRNLFRLERPLPTEELCEEWAVGPAARVERIVSTGQASPPGFWYDQERDEWVALLSGAATLLFEGGERVEL
ncbi:MAG TPA: cupin, partial [Acidobacteriota bacterium]|nr:cupin [Acidobacteriota bacterium]